MQLNKNEFEIVEQIAHPHIVRVYELLEDDYSFYIVMELMSGGSLSNRIRDAPGGYLTEAQSVGIIHQLLLALNFMHGLGIMHRDIKPDNVLCEDFSDLPRDQIQVKLADFGLAIKQQPGEKI